MNAQSIVLDSRGEGSLVGSGAELIGCSAPFRNMLEQLELVADTDSTVLLCGETGTGKELVARFLHARSRRQRAPLVRLNCAAIPANLLESELFGHERGAFTGAVGRRVGRFEQAQHGSIFLDEIGDLAVEVQPKLLRVLQEREFERVGGRETLRADVRLIAATHRNLAEMCKQRRFREDLYYRLNVFPIVVPPLRERTDDIPLLVSHFIDKFATHQRKHIAGIDPATLAQLRAYDWPGNVRELQNVLERAVILSNHGALSVELPTLHSTRQTRPSATSDSLDDFNRAHILSVLRSTNGVVSGPNGAAVRLGMKRSTLNFRMKKLGIRWDAGSAGRSRSGISQAPQAE